MRRMWHSNSRSDLGRRIRRRPLHLERLESRALLAADAGVAADPDAATADSDTVAVDPPADVELPPADSTTDFVPVVIICPGVTLPPAVEVDPVFVPDDGSNSVDEAAPVDTGAEDTGSDDTNAVDAGSDDTGSSDVGGVDAGSDDAGSDDTGSLDPTSYLDQYNAFLQENPDWLSDHGADGIQLCVMTPSVYVPGLELSNPGEARAFDAWFAQTYTQPSDSLILTPPWQEPRAWCVLPTPVEEIQIALPTPPVGETISGVTYISDPVQFAFATRFGDFSGVRLGTLPCQRNAIEDSFVPDETGLAAPETPVQPEARAAAFASPFAGDQSAYAQLAASVFGGSGHSADGTAESQPVGGRRRAR
mgnify:CR=1 FL=1